MAVFRELLLQPLDLLKQQALLLSKFNQFFFCCHVLTLSYATGFGKSLGDLTSYTNEIKK